MNFTDSGDLISRNNHCQETIVFESLYESNEAAVDLFAWTSRSTPETSGGSTTLFYEEIQSTTRQPPRLRRMEANARERDRTLSVNSAFSILRSLIPTEPRNRKLSKIEILRLATSYIDHLNNVREARLRGDINEDTPCIKDRLKEGFNSMKRSTTICTFCLTNKKRQRQ